MPTVHIIERAFQMADDPLFVSFGDIRAGLAAEGYGAAVMSHLDGESIRRQLRGRIARKTAAV